MRSGWRISEQEAAERDRKAAADLRAVYDRCIVAGMPAATQRMKLTARGFDAAELRRLLPLMRSEGAHG